MSLRVGDDKRWAELRAVANPVRLQILSLLTSTPMTAAEIARELDLNTGSASYHLRTLHASGIIELVAEERIRGGLAKRFRYDAAQHAARALDGGGRPEPDEALFAALAREMERRARLARHGGPNAVVDAELWISPEVWRDAVDRIGDVVGDLHRAAQKPAAPGAVRTSTTIALFAMTGQ